MAMPHRDGCTCALLSAVLAFFAVLVPLAHAGATIEDIPGVYRRFTTNIGCPTTITVYPANGLVAQIATIAGKCRPGKTLLRERPTASEGDSITTLLVERGEVLVGTIVLGKTTSPVTCPEGLESERIESGPFMNFIRPRTGIEITLGNQTTRFKQGQYYVILREACDYVRKGPAPTPAAPTKPPTIIEVPNLSKRS